VPRSTDSRGSRTRAGRARAWRTPGQQLGDRQVPRCASGCPAPRDEVQRMGRVQRSDLEVCFVVQRAGLGDEEVEVTAAQPLQQLVQSPERTLG